MTRDFKWQTWLDQVVEQIRKLSEDLGKVSACMDPEDIEWIWSWLLPDRCSSGIKDKMLFPRQMMLPEGEELQKYPFLSKEYTFYVVHSKRKPVYDDRGTITLIDNTNPVESLGISHYTQSKMTLRQWMDMNYRSFERVRDLGDHMFKFLSELQKTDTMTAITHGIKGLQSGDASKKLFREYITETFLHKKYETSERIGIMLAILRALKTAEDTNAGNSLEAFLKWLKQEIDARNQESELNPAVNTTPGSTQQAIVPIWQEVAEYFLPKKVPSRSI